MKLFLILILSASIFFICCEEKTNPVIVDKNNPPKIISLTSQSNTAGGLDLIQLVCLASDIDGDKLEYSWSAINGSISGNGSIVYWSAPNALGNYLIICTVNDNKGGTVSDSIVINVETLSNLPLQITQIKLLNQGRIENGQIVEIMSETNKIESESLKYKWNIHGGSFDSFISTEKILKFNPLEEKGYIISNIVWNNKNEYDYKSINLIVGDTIAGNDYVKMMNLFASKNSYNSNDTLIVYFYAVTSDHSPIDYEITVNGFSNSGGFQISSSFDTSAKPFIFAELNKFINEDKYTLIISCCAFDNKKGSDIKFLETTVVR
ncbi:MAG: hypothetical protein KJ571_09740 [Bacteroidetes bacterium]|nr:hypothetical protein [Bacteroidota bacterium]